MAVADHDEAFQVCFMLRFHLRALRMERNLAQVLEEFPQVSGNVRAMFFKD
jgi:hypothetical protein